MELNDKQKQIVCTAEQLFALKGFDGTSVRDIAEKAGVNIAMISYYFGSKEKLMEALFEQRTLNVKLRVESLLHDESSTWLEKMNVLIDDYIDKVILKQQFFKIMLCEQVVNKNPVITGLVSDLKRKNADEINKIIKAGQEKGEFKKEADIVLMLATLTGFLTQMMLNLQLYREYNSLTTLSEEDFQQHLKEKMRDHLKFLFKSLLTYEK